MAVIKVTLVDSSEKMRNQNSGYSIIIPQGRYTEPLSEQKRENKKSFLDGYREK